jgi:hypothetical protein
LGEERLEAGIVLAEELMKDWIPSETLVDCLLLLSLLEG